MSEQPSHRTSTPEDEASEAGATSEGFGNLSIEDDAEGTVNPADLAGTGGPDDDAVDGQQGAPMSEESSSLREPDDAMARQSGAVSEDVQPLTTDEDAEKTARGSLQGAAGPEGTDTPDSPKTD